MEKAFSFGKKETEASHLPDLRPFRELKLIKSKKTGQLFVVTRLGHETILPISYYEKMVENKVEEKQ